MTIKRIISCFDKGSELLRKEFSLPENFDIHILKNHLDTEDDDQLVLSYQLKNLHLELTKRYLLDHKIDMEKYEYFIESYED